MRTSGTFGQMRGRVFGVCMSVMGVSTVWAGTTIRVAPNGNDANDGSTWALAKATIQAAVNAAGDGVGDTVLVSNGTFTLTSQISVTKGVRVTSLNGRGHTFINGNYPTVTNRCFDINNAGAMVDGFTITNAHTGASDYGGGVQISSAGGTISNCVIAHCHSDSQNGGGLDLNQGGLAVLCVISNNSCPNGLGGGVFVHSPAAVLDHCDVVSNSAQYGAGVVCYNGIVTNCTIRDNWNINGSWFVGGGGISMQGGVVTDCRIINNRALGNRAGGLFFDGGTVRGCMIVGNSSYNVGTGSGGGVWLKSNCTLQNSTIASNTTPGGISHGGGIYSEGTGNTVENCRIFGNTVASAYGGGVFMNSGCLVRNSLIWSNTASSGGGLFLHAGAVAENCTIVGGQASAGGGGGLWRDGGTLTNCIIYFNQGDNYADWGGTWDHCCTTPAVSGAGNTSADPGFVDFAAGDFHLRLGSPCVNKGRTKSWMYAAKDLDKTDRVKAEIVDMGAFELYIERGTMALFR